MNKTIKFFISECNAAIKAEDGTKFRNCITISPGASAGDARAEFPEPSDFDLYNVEERFRPVIKYYLKLMKAIYKYKSIEATFVELNEMLNSLIRAAEFHTNWINESLINSLNELITVYKVIQQRNPEDLSTYEFQDAEVDGFGMPSKGTTLEQLATTINKAFKVSLNDKNLDLRTSKRNDIYFFLANLMKVYFKLNKLELAKSVEKALKGTRFNLPNMKSSVTNKKYSIIYLYYSSLLSLDDGDYISAETKLDDALSILCYHAKPYSKQSKQILLILLPLKLYNKNQFIKNDKFWSKYPDLKLVYKDNLFPAILKGNISKFDESLKKFEIIFLKNHLYLLIEKMRMQCYLRLVRRTFLIHKEFASPGKDFIVPLSCFQVAFEYSKYHMNYVIQVDLNNHSFNYSTNEVECILASLISQKPAVMKGYISHSNKCMVFSKSEPFVNDSKTKE
ncbi:uncharacterized protein RJT20DRAFT_36377 [Scheffersomyces xylosifermentans]|uniref:uncharacterized protein n=1 Tax=Scheffersomyces xylosifermentans TaxID=1304137 RepID=UPI00315CF7EE